MTGENLPSSRESSDENNKLDSDEDYIGDLEEVEIDSDPVQSKHSDEEDEAEYGQSETQPYFY